jgi:hypothetical protein
MIHISPIGVGVHAYNAGHEAMSTMRRLARHVDIESPGISS